MVLISYNTGCRNCLQSDGMRKIYPLMDGDIDKIQTKTEFQIITEIEKFSEQNNITCDFCSSENVEVFDVEVNENKLYDYDKIVERCQEEDEFILQININKSGTNITLNPAGSLRFEKNFLKQAFIDIRKTIMNRPDNHFKIHENGVMLMCVTGGNYIYDIPYTRIETFRSVGLSKEQILNEIQKFKNHTGISKSIINLDSNFFFKSSANLRYENSTHVSGPNVGSRRAIKVEPNIIGWEGYNINEGDGYIVTVFNLNKNNTGKIAIQLSPTPMRIVSQTSDKIVLRGYPTQVMSNSGWIDYAGDNYGLTISIKDDELENCIYHFHDKNVDIEYLP